MLRQLKELDLEKAYNLCHAMNHPLRYGIVQLLDQNKELTVTQIYFKLRISQSIASQHLAVLRQSGIVSSRKEGKQVFYVLNKAVYLTLCQAIQSMNAL
ncbi:MAG: ArsR family transcriptional regulator [Bacteroidetes bacterium]|jgi:ArsR family transcriptional regulator|nr:ArsR family transcriptional regulator [Bacteroidota bacterium]